MTRQKGVNWQPLFEDYKGKWVALKQNETTIVASGTSAKTVYIQAQKQGLEVPILFKVPQVSLPHVGQLFV